MATYVVDTHALIWFLTGSLRLGDGARAAMLDTDSALVIPAIALAESLWIIDKRASSVTSQDLLTAISADRRISVYPLTGEIVEMAHGMAAISEMHDRQIAATALAYESATLLTRDQDIIASGVVTTLW